MIKEGKIEASFSSEKQISGESVKIGRCVHFLDDNSVVAVHLIDHYYRIKNVFLFSARKELL